MKAVFKQHSVRTVRLQTFVQFTECTCSQCIPLVLLETIKSTLFLVTQHENNALSLNMIGFVIFHH